jgi:hypothetical protein
MATATDLANVSAASERFFRLYHAHCIAPDRDTLFSLLGAGHSLNDRLKAAAGIDFLDFQEFVALKCLRNYFHHQQELRHVVRLIPIGDYPVITDLVVLCLLPKQIVDAAIEESSDRYRKETQQACENVFHWYDPVVNINPCLFNFVVLVYERLCVARIPLVGDAVEQFEASYRYEEAIGSSHFVDGILSTYAGNLNELLSDILATEELRGSAE